MGCSSLLGVALGSPRLLRSSVLFWALSCINGLVAILLVAINPELELQNLLAAIGQLVLGFICCGMLNLYAAHVDFERDMRYMNIAVNLLKSGLLGNKNEDPDNPTASPPRRGYLHHNNNHRIPYSPHALRRSYKN